MEEIKDIEQEFIEYISTIKDIQLLVFKLDIDKKRQYMGKIYNFNPCEDDLYEIVRNKYGSGEFYIQSKNGNRLGRGITIYIAENKGQETTTNNSLEKKIDTLLELLAQKQIQKEDTEEKFLQKLQLYKNIFETKNNFDSSIFIKEMIKSYREGLETGKTIVNPPEPEKKDILETLLPTLLLSMQPMQQQKIIKSQSDINNKQQGLDMYKYIVLFNKVKDLSYENNIEKFEQKINTLTFDIIDFYPEILQFIKLISTENIDFYVNEIKNRFKITINDNEKIVILRLVDEIKKIEAENETANNNA